MMSHIRIELELSRETEAHVFFAGVRFALNRQHFPRVHLILLFCVYVYRAAFCTFMYLSLIHI